MNGKFHKKFFRTKDRIVEFEGHFAWIDDIEEETKTIKSYCLYQTEQEPYSIKEGEIVNESDTIEELCDIYLVENEIKDKSEYSVEHRNIVENLKYHILAQGLKIYGLIFAKDKHGEPILKTVAKMDKKGEWELL